MASTKYINYNKKGSEAIRNTTLCKIFIRCSRGFRAMGSKANLLAQRELAQRRGYGIHIFRSLPPARVLRYPSYFVSEVTAPRKPSKKVWHQCQVLYGLNASLPRVL